MGRCRALNRQWNCLSQVVQACHNVLPHNLVIDPYAEQPDGADAAWMCETVYYPTAGLIEKYTFKENEA